jgi:hypothetical protein
MILDRSMTKVQLRYQLSQPIDAALKTRIAGLYGVYGLLRLEPEPDGLLVEYDASRLTVKDVESELRRAGVPIQLEV